MSGVVLPKTAKGDRSSTSFNKTVYSAIATALGREDIASRVTSEKDWRHKYVGHIDALTEALVGAGDENGEACAKAMSALRAGLQEVRKMEFESADGSCQPLEQALSSKTSGFLIARVKGQGTPESQIPLEYNQSSLNADAVEKQGQAWANYGVMEPDSAKAIAAGAKQISSLKDRTFVILGVSSELGPAKLLLQAGATVVAVARKKSDRWLELLKFAQGTAGTLLFPSPDAAEKAQSLKDGVLEGLALEEFAKDAGADLIADAPALVDWVQRCITMSPGLVTVGTYLYLDGEANLRVTAVADYIIEQASKLGKDKVSFAWLASCSTTLVIPSEAVKAQDENHSQCTWFQKATGTRQQCPPCGAPDSNLFKGFEVMQGPNYALAQTMRQWRAMLLHSEGFVVSTPVTPMCRTESVTSNKTMATLLEGVAHIRPLEAFDPKTCQTAMFYILLTDLAEPVPTLPSPFHLFKRKAFHSGLWRCGFVMASLGIQTAVWGKIAGKKSPDETRSV